MAGRGVSLEHTILYTINTMYARGWLGARRGGRFRLLTAWLRLFRLRSI